MEAFFVFSMHKVDVAIAVIVNKSGHILLTQRFSPENKKTHLKWQLPGGAVEHNETISQACIRETREETGLTIMLIRKNSLTVTKVYEGVSYVLHSFRSSVLSGTINVEGDTETNAAKWFEYSKIRELETLEDTVKIIDTAI